MAQIGIKHHFPTISNQIILVWYVNNVEIGRHVFTAPHLNISYTIANIDPVVHVLKWYETLDGTTLNTLIADPWSIDASIYNQINFTRYEYVVDRGDGSLVDPEWHDPVNGATREIIDERLAGATYSELTVERRGTGILRNSEFTIIPTGGITVDASLPEFYTDEVFFITRYTMVAQQITGGGNKLGLNILTANTTFDNTLTNSRILCRKSSGLMQLALPAMASVADNEVEVYNITGYQTMVEIALSGAETTQFAKKLRNKIYLAPGEVIRLVWKAGVLHSLPIKDNYLRAGTTFMNDQKDVENAILCDGTEYNLTDPLVVRLYAELKPEQIVTYAEWNTTQSKTIGDITRVYYVNRGKVAVDTVAGKLKVPDLRGQSFRVLSNYTGITDTERMTQGPGGRQAFEVAKHKHGITYRDGKSDESESGTSSGFIKDPAINGSGTQRVKDTDTVKGYELTGGTEVRVDNDGKYGLIYM